MIRALAAALLALAITLPAWAAEPVRIQLKWHHQFQFAGYYVALEQGFFAEEGLDVELLERDPGENNILQVLRGEADYGVADSVLLLYNEYDAGVHIVAPIFQHSPNVLITLADSGLQSPRDLVSRRIRLYDNETEGFPIMAMLAEQGVLASGFVRQPYTSDFGVLARGETDAIYGYSTNEPYLLRQQGHEVHLIDPSHYGIDLYGDMLFTTEQEARDNPQRVAAMRRAVLRGWEYALDNKAEIARLILDKYSQRKSFDALMFEAQGIEQAVSRFTVPLGTLNAGRLQYIADIYARHGLLDRHFSIDRRIFFDRGDSSGINLTESEQAFLRQHPEIRVAIDRNWYPLDFVDENGQHAGIAAAYLARLSALTGISFVPATEVDWNTAMQLVENRELDMFAMAAATPARSVYASFTRPYIRSPMVIVTTTEQDYVNGAAGLRGKLTGVVNGYASHEWMSQNHPDLPLRTFDTTVEGLEAVSTGKVHAFVDNLASVSFLIKQHGLSNLKVSGQMPIAFDLSMGVRSDWPQLLSILQKGLNAISDEEKAAIYDRWIRLEFESRLDLAAVAPYFAGLFLMLLLVTFEMLRVRRLERKLREANTQLREAERHLTRQNQDLERLSVTDKLTGIFNRVRLDEALNEHYRHARRYGRPVSVALLDLDFFKRVNDVHGHQAGDAVLVRFAEMVAKIVRKNDVFGRWGGEEFMLICPETTAFDAVAIAEKIRQCLEQEPFDPPIRQTVSCGIAELQPGQSLSEWISACDAQLYQAKSQGRNRVVA